MKHQNKFEFIGIFTFIAAIFVFFGCDTDVSDRVLTPERISVLNAGFDGRNDGTWSGNILIPYDGIEFYAELKISGSKITIKLLPDDNTKRVWTYYTTVIEVDNVGEISTSSIRFINLTAYGNPAPEQIALDLDGIAFFITLLEGLEFILANNTITGTIDFGGGGENFVLIFSRN